MRCLIVEIKSLARCKEASVDLKLGVTCVTSEPSIPTADACNEEEVATHEVLHVNKVRTKSLRRLRLDERSAFYSTVSSDWKLAVREVLAVITETATIVHRGAHADGRNDRLQIIFWPLVWDEGAILYPCGLIRATWTAFVPEGEP